MSSTQWGCQIHIVLLLTDLVVDAECLTLLVRNVHGWDNRVNFLTKQNLARTGATTLSGLWLHCWRQWPLYKVKLIMPVNSTADLYMHVYSACQL